MGVALVGYRDAPEDGQVVGVQGFCRRDVCGGGGGARDLAGRDGCGCGCAAVVGEAAVGEGGGLVECVDCVAEV